MRTLEEALNNKTGGLHYGNRILLPFVADILKVAVEQDIITDFSSSKHGAEYTQHFNFTEIYFHDIDSLKSKITTYETVKMVIVEKGEDIFDMNSHIKLALHIKDDHQIEIEKVDGDILFIE